MSFTFNWPRFSDQFHYDAIQMLNNALNKGNKPPIIADRIEVVELEMGTQPPELEVRDIGDLTVDQFRGIFRLTYSGDAHLVLKTKVQANPLNHKQSDIHLMTGSGGMLAAKDPLVVPMLLRLSHFKLNSYVVLVVSKQKGITLVFKTDPLQNVDINSTFDSIAVIQKFIQREIEGQLRQMFREDLPGIIHRLSQQWVKAKVEAPYLNELSPPHVAKFSRTYQSSPSEASMLSMPLYPHINGLPRLPSDPQSLASLRTPSYSKRPRSTSGFSSVSVPKSRTPKKSLPSNPIPADPVTFPDLENFDPTYGLRPEGLPTKSVFRGFRSLFKPDKGLANLTEDDEEDEDDDEYDDTAPFDVVDGKYAIPMADSPVYNDVQECPVPQSEYETIPAIGGGTITRPRVYHSQSMVQTCLGSPAETNSPASSLQNRPPLHLYRSLIFPRSGFTTPSHLSNGAYNPIFPEWLGHSRRSTSFSSTSIRPPTPNSSGTQSSMSSSSRGLSTSTPPTEPSFLEGDDYTWNPRIDPSHFRQPPSSAPTASRRPSFSGSAFGHGFTSPSFPHNLSDLSTHPFHASPPTPGEPKIVLRPSLNNSIHTLSTLSHSNHTLSPYTRALQHFTVRSVPPRTTSLVSTDPVRAKRKRTFRLAEKSKTVSSDDIGTTEGPTQKTQPRRTGPNGVDVDLDASDMDRYFRTHDDDPHAMPPLLSLESEVPNVNSSIVSPSRNSDLQQQQPHLPRQLHNLMPHHHQVLLS